MLSITRGMTMIDTTGNPAMPAGIAEVLAMPFTDERWLAAWAQTLRIPEGEYREFVLDGIADWVAEAALAPDGPDQGGA